MNNKFNSIKETFSNIYPCDECIERVLDITKKDNKKRIKPAYAVAAVFTCLAIIITASVTSNSVSNISESTISQSDNTENNISNFSQGFAIIAYADEKVVDNFNVKTPIKSKIGAIDIRGKSQGEIDAIVDKLYSDYNLVDWNFPSYEALGKNVLTLLDTNTTFYNNAVIYQFRNGFFDIYLDNNYLNEIKEIRVKNENQEADAYITSLAVYYDDNDLLIDEYEMFAKGIHTDHISGDEYRKDIKLENMYNEKMFGISWYIGIPIVEKLNDNPDYDLTQINDTLTIEVEFNDGSISKSTIELTFDMDGYMFAKSKSLEYIR